MPAPAPLRTLLGPRCMDDAGRLRQYEIPERGTLGHASCVLLPESEDEVGAIINTCNAHALKLVISAGRTGLVEAQRPQGEAVLSLERLNRVLAIDKSQGSATVQAGVAIDALNALLEARGLMFPIEMASSSAATVGGCVANGSAGANAVCYGTAAQMCKTAWGWWGNGQAAGPCQAAPWRVVPPAQLAISSALIHPGWGLVGSQGALGVITRVQLRLHPIPLQREAALIPLPNMGAAMDILAAARVEFGGDVEEFEFISRAAMNLVRLSRGAAFRLPFERDMDAPFYVLLQLKSAKTAHQDDLAARLYQFLSGELALPDGQIGYAPLKVLKEIRHAITECSKQRMMQLGGGRLSFDTATPAAVFGAYLDALEAAIRRDWPRVEFAAFGHAGVGGAHLHLLGTREQPVSAHAQELIQRVFDVTAQHGVGSKWGDEFLRRTPPGQLAPILAAKRERDPHNILNPRCFGFDRLI